MFKGARWRSEKNKIKAVFKLQFEATQVPEIGWETMVIALVPSDVGKPTVRSEKAASVDGKCHWAKPILETVKLATDSKTGKINDRTYRFAVSANVTIQRMQGDDEGRVADENGDSIIKPRRRTLQSQLSKCDDEEVAKATVGMENTEDKSVKDNEGRMIVPLSGNMPLHTGSNGNLQKSHSFDAISASGSDASSGRNTPRESQMMRKNSHDTTSFLSPLSISGTPKKLHDTTSFLSPLSISGTPKKLLKSSSDWSGSSAPDGSTDGSTNNSGDSGLKEGFQDSETSLEKLGGEVIALTRKLDISEMEIQTLRKQIIKENRRAQDLSKEINSLREERDSLKRECEELKTTLRRTNHVDSDVSDELAQDAKDPWLILEEIKKELNHEKNLNANVRLQLEKTKESNSQLILTIRDLEEKLEQKDRDLSCARCPSRDFIVETDERFKEMEYSNRNSHLSSIKHDKEEQHALDVLMKGQSLLELEKKIIDLHNEIELYKKDREELEMQMEQLALDYEILKQENHGISSKLEQAQLREQLRMQYECSAHLAIISDLEAHVEILEKELQQQAEAFEADVESIVCAKVELEQRALKAEEALRKVRWRNTSTAERLQEEFKLLSQQMSSTFHAHEKSLRQALKEASELRLQKNQLEELLEKAQEELSLVQGQYRVKFEQLLSLTDFKSKEKDNIILQLKNKSKLQNEKQSLETKMEGSSEEVLLLKNEIEKLKGEGEHLSQQNELKKSVIAQMEYNTSEGGMIALIESPVEDLRNEKYLSSKDNKMQNGIKEINRNCSSPCEGIVPKEDEHFCYSKSTENGGNSSRSPRIQGKACRHDLNSSSKMSDMRNTRAEPEKEKEKIACTSDHHKIGKVCKEVTLLKEKNMSMEAELKEMQERYSETSLKLAEVESEGSSM
ncbi:hypothetical protein ACMD2_20621 [Ananas comosus]|uniref:C2 NT-type domain-containing protein n=1 Tax=Ananas comosus TaxID=4615 RepID=A0A199VKY5_ANACO|nr:hypothetical protein ACMD2_20621 [Ananas comosus]